MKMKAIITTKYGAPNVLQLQEIEMPSPKSNEVLIRMYAAPVSAADTMMRTGTPRYGRLFLGLFKPNNPIPGTGVSGVVEAVGSDVTTFKKGDEVFGEVLFSAGSHAEYVCVPEDGILTKKPANTSFEEAAPICDGALTSICFLKDLANVQPGQHVLINGASGSLGTAAVQLAKSLGAEVTGVCSTTNVEMVRSLGADWVIDYTKEDFTQSDHRYDVIFDTVGKSSFGACKSILSEQGQYLSPVLSLPILFQMLWTSYFGQKKVKFSATGLRAAPELRVYLEELRQQLASGTLRSVIDRRYHMERVADAHTYVDTGRKKGNVVLIIG